MAVCLFLSGGWVEAQAQAKKSQSLPQVPITYPGDTDETIRRRAQWIEEAKKEGNTVIWWGVIQPGEVKREVAEFNKVYPSIKIDYWRGEGELIATKLDTDFNAHRQSADMAYGGEPVNFPRWRKRGFLGSLPILSLK